MHLFLIPLSSSGSYIHAPFRLTEYIIYMIFFLIIIIKEDIRTEPYELILCYSYRMGVTKGVVGVCRHVCIHVDSENGRSRVRKWPIRERNG